MPRAELPDIDERKCTLCGDCLRVCPTDCLRVSRGIEIVVSPQSCVHCTLCAVVCPVGAIAMESIAW